MVSVCVVLCSLLLTEPRQAVPVDDSLTFSDMESSDKEWSDSSDYESHKQKSEKAVSV